MENNILQTFFLEGVFEILPSGFIWNVGDIDSLCVDGPITGPVPVSVTVTSVPVVSLVTRGARSGARSPHWRPASEITIQLVYSHLCSSTVQTTSSKYKIPKS